ncbi:MAG: ABC transporter permease [Planctomycetota bacterium]
MTPSTAASPLPEVRYSAESSPRSSLHHLLRVYRLPGLLRRHRVMLKHFVGRELRGRFADNLLGPLWVLLHPVFLFAVYFLVFTQIQRTGAGADSVWFACYLFSGLICFHFITQSTAQAMNAIVANGNIVKKVKFPCEVLPIVPALVEIAVFGLGLVIVAIVGFASGRASLDPALFALPWFLLVLITFAVGIGMLLANLIVFVRDVAPLYGLITTAWFFLSPNFWTPNFFGTETLIGKALQFNPTYHLLLAERQVLGLAREDAGFTGSVVGNLGIASAWAALFLALGYGGFMAHKHKYADLV